MANRLDLTLRINSEDRTGPARAGIQSVEQQLTRLRQTAGAFLALKVGEIISTQIGNVIKTADAYKTLEARLKLVSDNTSEYSKAQTELFGIAQRTRGDLAATYDVYGKLETIIKQLGGTQKQALTTTETLNQAIALTSQGAAQDAAALMQFSQALSSGVLRGDEFNSVMENSPGLAQALADGLNVPVTSLRQMAEAGQLTADKLVNALGNSAKSVEDKFKQLPLTVGGAMTNLASAFTVFIGQTDKSTGASAKLASGISVLANNLDAAGGAIKLIGAALLGNYVTGLIKSGEATLANRYATLQLAQAQQARLAVLQQTLRAEVLAAESKLAGINLNVRLAATEQQAAMGTVRQAEATNAYIIQLNRQRAAETQLATANTRLAGTMAAATPATGRLAGAMNLLGKAVSGVFAAFIAWDIGQTVGEWLNQFEKVRQGGSYLAESFILIQSGFEAMLSGMSFADRWAQVKQIHEDFNQIRAQSTDAAVQSAAQVNAAEQSKTEAVQKSAQLQAESWQKVQESVKNLSAGIDQEFARQTADLQRHLDERLAAIDASDLQELEKQAQRTTALTQAAQKEMDLAKLTAGQKLLLLTQSYDAEIAKLNARNASTEALERESIEKRKAIYGQLAQHYAAIVDRLGREHDREVQAARATAQSLKDLALQHQFELNDIERQGADEYTKIQSEKNEFDETLYKVKKEIAKGTSGDQELINGLLERAKELTQDAGNSAISLAQTDSEVSQARSENASRLNDLYGAQKTALENVQHAHEANADTLARKQAEAAGKLEEVNRRIDELALKLQRSYALQITVDTSQIDQAIAKLNSIPTEKTVTIHTVTVEGKQGGGFAGFDTGGKLPGWGGGDKIPAMLEAGEFVVRKEAVAKYGGGLLARLNAMKLSLGGLIPGFADGGDVDQEKERRKANLSKSLAEIEKQKAERERTEGEMEAIKGKVLSLASQASISNFGGFQRARSSYSILDQLLDGASKSSFGGNPKKWLDNQGTRLQLLVMYLRQKKIAFEDLPVRGALQMTLGKAAGGGIPGTGDSDSVPALLTPGEYVINKLAAASYGNVFLDAINRGVLPKQFNAGGPVGSSAGSGSVIVQFKAPGGQSAQAQFGSQSDVNQFLEVIRLSGGVTA